MKSIRGRISGWVSFLGTSSFGVLKWGIGEREKAGGGGVGSDVTVAQN